jgi:hypothetical protein
MYVEDVHGFGIPDLFLFLSFLQELSFDSQFTFDVHIRSPLSGNCDTFAFVTFVVIERRKRLGIFWAIGCGITYSSLLRLTSIIPLPFPFLLFAYMLVLLSLFINSSFNPANKFIIS